MSATCSGAVATWCCKIILSIWVVPWLFPAALYVATRPSVGLSKIPCTTGTWPWKHISIYTKSFSHQKMGQYDSKLLTPPIRKSWPASVWIPSYPPPHFGHEKSNSLVKCPLVTKNVTPNGVGLRYNGPRSGGFKASCGSVGSFPCAWGKASKITSWISWYKQWKNPHLYFFWVDVPIKSLHGYWWDTMIKYVYILIKNPQQ